MVRQHDFEQLAVEALRPRFDLVEIEARLDVEIIGAGAVLKIEIDQAGRGLVARAALLSSSIAVCTASVVTPAPPTAGRKVKICASVVSALGGGLATRAQVRTRSTGDTGLTRKSATRICIRRRATASSKFCVMATTGGRLPIRNTIRSSASQFRLVAAIDVGDDDGGAFELDLRRAPTAGP